MTDPFDQALSEAADKYGVQCVGFKAGAQWARRFERQRVAELEAEVERLTILHKAATDLQTFAENEVERLGNMVRDNGHYTMSLKQENDELKARAAELVSALERAIRWAEVDAVHKTDEEWDDLTVARAALDRWKDNK